MDYLQKIRTASLKVAAMLQNVGQDIGLAASASTEKVPSEAFVQRFQSETIIFRNKHTLKRTCRQFSCLLTSFCSL